REKLGPIPSVKAILCGSENLYSFQRQLIQNIFQCRVYSWYGHSEKAVLAGECENTEQYHVFPEYGIAELIDNSDAPAANENDLGEIVGTSLHNFAFPMIRYRTMDLARLGPKSCACGRNHMLIKSVEGRLQELIVSGTGRYVSMTAINMHTDVFDNVRQFQFYQENPGQVTFNIVRKPTYTDSDTGRIRHELANKLGEDFGLTISFVDDIPRTATGKYRFAIQRLSLTMGDR
ncbi:MAG: phenylacetate--CoA ligase family protein, partial [Candidatus Zixiibacteriota bacterium]